MGSATEFIISIDPASRGALETRLVSAWPSIVAAGGTERLRDTRPAVTSIAAGFSSLSDRFGQGLRILGGLGATLLAFGWLSLSGMFAVSAARRLGEFQIRRAIGAGTAAIVREVLRPALAAGAIGGALAVAFAWTGAHALVVQVTPTSLPYDLDVSITWARAAAIVGVTLVFAVLSALPAAWWSAVRSARFGASSRTMTARPGSRRWLVALQAAGCVMFVATALTFGGAVARLAAVPLGFHPGGVYYARATAQPGGYVNFDTAAYYPALLDRIAARPGVESAAISRSFGLPIVPSMVPAFASDRELAVIEDLVSPSFFETVGIARLTGRSLTWQDTAVSQPVGIVSESLARLAFGRLDVVGETIDVGAAADRQTITIVGVAADAVYGPVTTPERRVVYRPSLQRPAAMRAPILHLRARSGAADIESTLMATVADGGREAIASVSRLDKGVAEAFLQERLLTEVTALVAGLALLLMAIALYATLADTLAADARANAIRAALGAGRWRLAWRTLQGGFVLAVAGAVAGAPAAWAAGELCRHYLAGLPAMSFGSIAAALGVSVAVGIAASIVPARRATVTDVVSVLNRPTS
jgi:putative ABC transport system permease protein